MDWVALSAGRCGSECVEYSVVLDCEEVRVLVGEFEKDRNEWIRALSQKTE